MKNVFKKAHSITKKIIRKGDSYRATFSLALKFVYSQIKKGVNKMLELKGTEKQVKWANDIRERILKIKNIFEESIKNMDMTKVNEKTLEGIELRRVEKAQESFENILNKEDAKFFIDNFGQLKDYMISNLETCKNSDKIGYIWCLVKSY